MKSQTGPAQLLDTSAMGRTLMSLESPVIGSKLSSRAVKSDSYPQARLSDAQTFHTAQSQQAGNERGINSVLCSGGRSTQRVDQSPPCERTKKAAQSIAH